MFFKKPEFLKRLNYFLKIPKYFLEIPNYFPKISNYLPKIPNYFLKIPNYSLQSTKYFQSRHVNETWTSIDYFSLTSTTVAVHGMVA